VDQYLPKFRNLLILFGDSSNLQYVLVLKFSKTKNGCIKLGEHCKKLKTSGGFFSSPGLSMPKRPPKIWGDSPFKILKCDYGMWLHRSCPCPL